MKTRLGFDWAKPNETHIAQMRGVSDFMGLNMTLLQDSSKHLIPYPEKNDQMAMAQIHVVRGNHQRCELES